VDEKSFAPKPRDYKLVQYWYDTKPLDQCHHRKRRFVAYLLTLTVLPLMQIAKVLGFMFGNVVVGLTLINWRSIFKPFTYGAYCGQRYWKVSDYADKNGGIKAKKWWRALLNWRLIIIYGLLAYSLTILFAYIAPYLLPLLAILSCLALLVFLAVVIIYLLNKSGSTSASRRFGRMRKTEQKLKKKNELLRQRQNRELEQIACYLLPEEISYATLPKEKKTVHLRFQHLKSTVCRPFAGS
jgi:hypothetical protein